MSSLSISCRLRIVLALLVLPLISGSLQAQSLPACRRIAQEPGLKVVLDDLRLSAPQGSTSSLQVEPFMTLLSFVLEARFKARFDDPRFTAVMILRCDRYPASKTFFDEDILQNLNDNNVVLELWGDVVSSQSGKQRAVINYLLVPVRLSEFGSSDRGIYTVHHNLRGADELLHLLENEITAYALVSLGVKQLRNHQFDVAKKNLTEAQSQLTRLFGRAPDSDQKALLSYVHEHSCDTVRQARMDPIYSAQKGGLTSLSDAEVTKICAPISGNVESKFDAAKP
jgi:hypothetical protein